MDRFLLAGCYYQILLRPRNPPTPRPRRCSLGAAFGSQAAGVVEGRWPAAPVGPIGSSPPAGGCGAGTSGERRAWRGRAQPRQKEVCCAAALCRALRPRHHHHLRISPHCGGSSTSPGARSHRLPSTCALEDNPVCLSRLTADCVLRRACAAQAEPGGKGALGLARLRSGLREAGSRACLDVIRSSETSSPQLTPNLFDPAYFSCALAWGGSPPLLLRTDNNARRRAAPAATAAAQASKAPPPPLAAAAAGAAPARCCCLVACWPTRRRVEGRVVAGCTAASTTVAFFLGA